MSQTTRTASTPADGNRPGTSSQTAAPAGSVPFTLVLLSALLVLIPWSRTVGIVFLLLLFIPAVVVWARARKLADGSRGLTTATMIIGCGAFLAGAALSSEAAPLAPAPAVVAPPAQVVPAPGQLAPAPQPRVQAPLPAVPQAPRIAPAPRAPEPAPPPATESGASAYYKNCAEARAAGAAPLHAGDPGYRTALDRDRDGIACE